jgi:predicted enzyme related to lactoylglutathione lyase
MHMSTTFKLDGIALIFLVANLERTRTFYREVIGLELEMLEGYMLGKLPGTEFVFFEGETKPGTSPQVVFGLAVGGIDTLAERLVKQGVQVLTPVTEAPGGWAFEVADPDDHKLAFFQAASLPRTRAA